MQIKQISLRRLEISLTQEDLSAMDLCYEEIDCRETRTRTMFLSLLKTAALTTGFSPDTRVFIEVYPTESGGCTVCFSNLDTAAPPKRWRVRRKLSSPVIYTFEDVNVLITSAIKLFRRCSHRIRKSMLYRIGQNWELVVYPLDTLEKMALSFLDEFAPRFGEGELAAAWLGEYADCVLEENAVDLLSAYFG